MALAGLSGFSPHPPCTWPARNGYVRGLMTLNEILSRKLLIVSGKGGVGKTSVAAAFGLVASGLGKKTLIVEINAAERISNLFGISEIGYCETELAKNLFAINLDPRSAFEEYVLEQIYSKKIYHLIFENKFVRSFLDATPGLNELLEIGKIWSITDREKDSPGKQKYDLVIMDAPATGHGLAFLNVPKVVAQAIRVGPLKTKAVEILKLIQDPVKTLLIGVTLAEEMPVNETLEMLHTAKESIQVGLGPVFANAIFPSVFSEEEWKEVQGSLEKLEKEESYVSLKQALGSYQKKVQLQNFYLNKLKLGLGDQALLELPYLFQPSFDRNAIEELAEKIMENESI